MQIKYAFMFIYIKNRSSLEKHVELVYVFIYTKSIIYFLFGYKML